MVKIEEVRDLELFRCIPEPFLRSLVEHAADVTVDAGNWLIREGTDSWFFIVLSGKFEAWKQVHGFDQPIGYYYEATKGDFAGETSLLLGQPSLVSIRAVETSRVMRLSAVQLRSLLEQSSVCNDIVRESMKVRVGLLEEYVQRLPHARVKMKGPRFDVLCQDVRAFLASNGIPYEWEEAEQETESLVEVDGKRLEDPLTLREMAVALGYKTQPSRSEYDVVIVGAGPAGLAAAVYGTSEGLSVLLIDRESAGGQAGTSTRIENYLGFPAGISGDDLTIRATQQAGKFGTDFIVTRQVDQISTREVDYAVRLDGGEEVLARTMILATGVDWRKLDAEGVDTLNGKGVLYGASKSEAPSVSGKELFIVGGGNSAGQAAIYFSGYANQVTLVVRGPGLSSSMSQYLINQIAETKNIAVLPNTVVHRALGQERLEALSLKNRAENSPFNVAADALFIMIGADASTDWLPQTIARDAKGFILTGRDIPVSTDGERPPFLLETSMPGIFAAGDVRHGSVKRVASGVGEGSMAIAFIHQYLELRDNAHEPALTTR